jgi:hypothetical protein
MNINILLLKRSALIAVIAASLATLTACPLMMPFMIAPMHSGGLHGGGEHGEDKIAQDLVEEGVAGLAANHGPYETLVVGRVSVQDVSVSAGEFRDRMVRTLRSRGEWKLVESETRARRLDGGSETLPPERALGLVDGQLYQEGDRLNLALDLVDYSSGGLFWSGLYSRPSAGPAGHGGH